MLIPQEKQSEIKEVLVAFDGSEASVGALLMAENLVMNTDIALRALTVIPSADHHAEAQLLVEKGEKYLREYWSKDVFMIK
ncbi:universal stress protein, partial [Acinetobacter baumannii]